MASKLFTIDARCSRCGKKTECAVRVKVITTLSALTNELNTDPEFTDSPGEGILIMSCDDFSVA